MEGQLAMPMADQHIILLTEGDLVARWRLASAKKLQSERSRGAGCPYIKIGRLVRYRLADVEAFEAAHLVNPVLILGQQ